MQDEALVGIEGRLAAIGGWSTEETRRQIDSYLAFMAKCGVSETPLPPPDESVDLVWHVHMLHPRRYQTFCQERFGRVIDHDLGDTPQMAPGGLAKAGCNGPAVSALAKAGCNEITALAKGGWKQMGAAGAQTAA